VASAGERVPKLIRAAQTEKIPVTAVIGEKEAEDGSLAVRLLSLRFALLWTSV
jgi:threonyl-tRNA synthetase